MSDERLPSWYVEAKKKQKALTKFNPPTESNELSKPEYIEKAKRLFKVALSQKAKSTVESYQYALRHFANYLEMESASEAIGYLLSLTRIDAETRVLEYLGWMEEKNLAPSTMRTRLAAIKFYVSTAHRVQWIDWTLDTQGPPQENVKEVEGPTPEQFEQILGVANDLDGDTGKRNQLLIYMLAFMGLRISEALTLDMEHIDLKKKRIAIKRKGRKQKREWRTVPKKTFTLIREYIKCRGKHDGPLFITFDYASDGKGRLSRVTAYRTIRNIGEKAGMPKLHPHAFRHFSVTEVLEMTDGNERKAMKHSGHKSRKMIDVYEDKRKDEAGEIAQDLEDKWLE